MDPYPLFPVTGPCRFGSVVHTVVSSTWLHHMSPSVHVLRNIDKHIETADTLAPPPPKKKTHINTRLGKARCTFAKHQTIWKSKQCNLKTKTDNTFYSNVKSILLYDSECWRMIKADMAVIEAFHNGCLRKVLSDILD